MKTSFSEYQVVLFLSKNANLENYDLKVGDQTCNIFVCENVIKENDQFNLVITDKNPEELTKSKNITTALIIKV